MRVKARKKKLMIFNFDFKKVYDSFSWDYLLEIEYCGLWRHMVWVDHVSSCFGRTSILVNSLHTKEFAVQRGLRLEDPLCLFLFILAMERKSSCGFRASQQEFSLECEFLGQRLQFLIFFYVDDAILLYPWKVENARIIVYILFIYLFIFCLRFENQFT